MLTTEKKTVADGAGVRFPLGFCLTALLAHGMLEIGGFPVIDWAVSLWRYLAFLITLVFFCRKPVIWKIDVVWALLGVWVLFTTVLRNGSLPLVIGPAIDIICLIMIFKLLQYDMEQFVQKATWILSAFCYLNVVLVILFPDGLWMNPESGKAGFLLGGNYNGMGPRCLVALATNMLCYRHGRVYAVNFWFLYVVSVFTVLFVGSMTSSVCLVILLGLWGGAKWLKWRRGLIWTFFAFYMLAQIAVVFVSTNLEQYPVLKDFVEDTLQKDFTFTRRTVIWEECQRIVPQSPWVGYGVQDNEWNNEHIDGPGPHNFVYRMLVDGGFPLLVLCVLCIILSLKPAYRSNDRRMCYLLLGINVLFFMMIWEFYPFFVIAYILLLCYYFSISSLECQSRQGGIENKSVIPVK